MCGSRSYVPLSLLPCVQDHDHGDLIILGLAYSVTDAELKKYFEQYGTVVSAEVSWCSAGLMYMYM